VIAGGGVTTFLALAWLTKLGSGRETLTYYHHEVAIFAVAALLAASLHAPILAHLDVTALALGTFLVFGRIGCLRAGCCHGRPWHRGVRYGAEHVEAGFPSYLRDLPLVPVQALESAAVALIVLIGAALFLDPRAPGRAFSFYLVAYAVVRLALEEARGDTARRHLRGLSEAQWTSLALIVATLSAELAGLLPGRGIGLLGAACALAECLAVGLLACRRSAPLDPRHLRELRRAARILAGTPTLAPEPVPVWVTSGQVRISAGRVGALRHVTLSREHEPLAAADAARLAEVVGSAVAAAPLDVIAGPGSTFHILLSIASQR
jgi:hypothetical protein